MSVGILILSLIFAGVQVGVGYIALAYEPIAEIFEAWPAWAITGCIFAVSMFLSFLLILIIGGIKVSSHAADFVRDHFARALALLLISVVFVTGLAIGGEFVYQISPEKREEKVEVKTTYTDLLYMLDTSSSMTGSMPNGTTTREKALRDAFKRNLGEMKEGQYISVLTYDDDAVLIQDWLMMDDTQKSSMEVVAENIKAKTMSSTNFVKAFTLADQQVKKSLDAGRNIEVLLITDAESLNSNILSYAPNISANGVKVHGILVGNVSESSSLRNVVARTGGTYYGAQGTVTALASQMSTITREAARETVVQKGFTIRDTLITKREERSTVLPATVFRILLLFVICFVFKLITNICIGNNRSSMGSHLLLSFVVALISALVVEFGYVIGLPMIAVTAILWVLMMCQFVFTDR